MGKKTQEKETNRRNVITTFNTLKSVCICQRQKYYLKILFEYFCCLPDLKKAWNNLSNHQNLAFIDNSTLFLPINSLYTI